MDCLLIQGLSFGLRGDATQVVQEGGAIGEREEQAAYVGLVLILSVLLGHGLGGIVDLELGTLLGWHDEGRLAREVTGNCGISSGGNGGVDDPLTLLWVGDGDHLLGWLADNGLEVQGLSSARVLLTLLPMRVTKRGSPPLISHFT